MFFTSSQKKTNMFSSNRSTTTSLTCGFKVNTNSPEWHKSMTKILNKITGGNFWIDVEEGMAYVTGHGDPNKLLKLMGSKSGKDAQMAFVKTGVDQHPQVHPHHHDHNFYNVGGYQNSHFGQPTTPYWPGQHYSSGMGMGMQPYQQQHQYPYSGGYNNYGYY